MKNEGFTLIDVLVGAALASIVFVGLFGAYQLGFRVVRQTERRIVAANIANEEMEKVQGMSYENIGVLGASLPFADGTLSGDKTVTRNGVDYSVNSTVKYIIDELDGVAEPDDSCPYDYKRVQVKVIWGGVFGGEAVFITDLSPADLNEECLETGGILKVGAIDAYGQTIISPLIEVFDATTGETVDSATPDNGQHYFPLTEGSYQVSVSKSSYSSFRTYGTDEVAIPENSHLEVVEGSTTPITAAIDLLSQLSVDTLTRVQTDEGEEIVAVPNVEFSLRGDKLIGWDAEEEPVYKYEENLNSGQAGNIYLSDMEWDDYIFSIAPTTGFILEETDPAPQPIELAPDTILEMDLYVATDYSLSVNVEDSQTGESVFSAGVTLSQSGLGYSEIQYTNEKGNTLFIPLEQAVYDIEVAAPGFNPYTSTVTITGNNQIDILLERVE